MTRKGAGSASRKRRAAANWLFFARCFRSPEITIRLGGAEARSARSAVTTRSSIRPKCRSDRWAIIRIGGKSGAAVGKRSEEHTSELQSLMRTAYAVFCLTKKKTRQHITYTQH